MTPAASCALLLGLACGSTLPQDAPPISGDATPTQTSQKLSKGEQNVTGKIIWSGMFGGFGIQWTKDDLFVQSVSGLERTWAPLAKKGFDEFAADVAKTNQTDGRSSNNCDYQRDFRVLSIVGTLISFQDEEYSDCGGLHPTTYRRFTTIDLAKPGAISYGRGEEAMDADLTRVGKVVKLTDYFNEGDVLRALLKDRVIQQALIEAGVSAPLRTLAELPELFSKNDYILSGSELELRPDFLTRFAFHHVEGEKVAIRINLPSLASAYRAKQIGLLLPIPPSLQQPLTLAATQREGFLMREAPPNARDEFTRINFKTGEGARH